MRRIAVPAVGAVSVLVLGVAAAVATPARDTAKTDIARGVMSTGGAVDITPGKETTAHRVTIAPGGSTGWHTHHAEGVFMVMSGTMESYGLDGPACEPVVVEAGNAAFVPMHPHHAHLVLNRGAEPLELTLVYFNVPPGEPTRLDAEAPAECPAGLR